MDILDIWRARVTCSRLKHQKEPRLKGDRNSSAKHIFWAKITQIYLDHPNKMFQKKRLTYGTVLAGLNFHQIFPPGFSSVPFFFWNFPSHYFFIKENRCSAKLPGWPRFQRAQLHSRWFTPTTATESHWSHNPSKNQVLDSHIHLCNFCVLPSLMQNIRTDLLFVSKSSRFQQLCNHKRLLLSTPRRFFFRGCKNNHSEKMAFSILPLKF